MHFVAPRHPRRWIAAAAALLILTASGCGSPNKVNIELRKRIAELESRSAELDRRHTADLATIDALQSRATTVPTLPNERVEALFTTHGLRFGKLTGGADLDPERPGDEGLKIFVVPIDDRGDALKAAGGFTVEAFDLSDAAEPLVGTWTFPAAEAATWWFGQGLLYEYVLTCPWQNRIPAADKLTIQVTFTDALTLRQFTEKRDVTIHPTIPVPTTTRPSASADPGKGDVAALSRPSEIQHDTATSSVFSLRLGRSSACGPVKKSLWTRVETEQDVALFVAAGKELRPPFLRHGR